MKTIESILISLILILLSVGPAPAGMRGQPEDISKRAEGAERVAVGTVIRTEPVWQTNEFGDKLIVSRTYVAVEETLKGSPATEVMMEVEGGTIDGLTLEVSDMVALKKGDRGVFFMKRGKSGHYRPYQRADGMLVLDKANRVKVEGNIQLDEVRRKVKNAKSK